MRKLLMSGAAFLLMISGCASQPDETEKPKTEEVKQATKEDDGFMSWTKVDSAEDAAREAGFTHFGVFNSITLDEMTFKDPTFSYKDGVAQAVYEQPACALYIRKVEGAHKAALSDRLEQDFAKKWTKTVDAIDVTMYGEAKGAATYFTWKDGNKEYGVTYQGLGGDEMTMDADEVATIVDAVQAADNVESAQVATAQPVQNPTTNQADMIAESEAIAIAQSASGGAMISTTKIQTEAHGWCWMVGCQDADGNISTYIVDNVGNAYLVDYYSGQPEPAPQPQDNSEVPGTMPAQQAVALTENYSGAKATSWQQVNTASNGWCWIVSTTDSNGVVLNYIVDNNGGVALLEAN